MAATPPSLYSLLQVPPEASAEQLRSAFRLLSKRFHPDTTELPEDEAAARFRQLQEAMSVLGDPEQRRRYDALLRAQALNREQQQQQRIKAAVWRPNTDPPSRRPLSGGEWFALLLLALALAFSLVLGIGLAWWRGVQVVQGGHALERLGALVHRGSAAVEVSLPMEAVGADHEQSPAAEPTESPETASAGSL